MNSEVQIQIKRVRDNADLALPSYQSSLSSGMDLRADVREQIVVAPGDRVMVPTGISLEIPAGFEAQVRPRSGLALKHGVTVLNSPGTVDADYRGEVCVILANLGREAFVINRGDRIAQIVIAQVTQARLVEVAALSDTERGSGGFGSTGR